MSILSTLADDLPWFRCSRWLYHLIKLMTGATVTFCLTNLGVPIWWACGLGMAGTVIVPHLVLQWRGVYRLNVLDTLFDITVSAGVLPTVIYAQLGPLYGAASAIGVAGLYVGLLAAGWNSP